MPTLKQEVLVILLLMIAAVFAVFIVAPALLNNSKAGLVDVQCPEKIPNVTVWRCQGFFDQLAEPMISYEHGRWSLKDADTVNHPIRFTDGLDCRRSSRTVEYTPDISIDGQNLSFDLLVTNLMGTDLALVPYSVETRVGQKKASWDREYPGPDALVTRENGTLVHLAAGETREIRIHAQLAVPPRNQSLKELIVIVPGPEVQAADGSVIRQDTTSEGDLMLVIQSPDTILQDPTPVRTQRPLTDAPGAPAWAEEDRRIVQAYLRNPDAVVVYERSESDSTIGNYHIYRTDEGEIYVNDQSRRVDRAGFYESVPPAKNVVIPQDRAQAIAQSYAAKNYPRFSTRNMVLTEANLLDHGDMGKEYSFGWLEQVIGIANGNFVAISISPDTGGILSYLSRDRTAPEITEPKITEEEAVKTASAYFVKSSSLSSTEGLQASARASVVPFLQNREMWIVNLHIDLPGDPIGFRCAEVYIDASTGEMALYNPCV